jgi:glycosyltransferase involved in cell wall biosynthesis
LPSHSPHTSTRPRSEGQSGLHVLLVLHQFFPHTHLGTERYTLELAHGLRELGHEATVLTMLPREGTGDYAAAISSYTWEGIRVLALDGFFGMKARFEDTFARPDLRDLWEEVLWDVQPDVVHACHLLNHTPEFLAVAHESGVPLVLTMTDFWGICWGGVLLRGKDGRSCEGPSRAAYNCVADWGETRHATNSGLLNGILDALRGTVLHDAATNALRLLPGRVRRQLSPEIDSIARRGRRIRERYELADAWIAPSQYLLDQYARSGYERERFHRIPYGIASPGKEEREALNARFARGRPESMPLRFGYLGQIAPHKGVHQLIEAFRSADLHDATLAIHGDSDSLPEYVQTLRSAAEGDPRVSLCGAYPSGDVYRILAGIDVLVIPSLWHENAPLVLLSALASGTPVVLPDARGMIEFVRPGKDALVYAMNDARGLADCLSRLEREPDLLAGLAANQKPYAFSGADCARVTLDVYRAVGAGVSRPRFVTPRDRIEPSLRRLSENEVPGCWNGDLLTSLARAQARGLEVLVPRGRGESSGGTAPRAGLRAATRRWLGRAGLRAAARRWLERAGSLRGGLRLAYQPRPCFSLWSFRRAGSLDFSRHPDFDGASHLEILARYNRGSQSVLRYRLRGEDEDTVHDFRVTWPKGCWSRLVVPLETKRGTRVTSLAWVPTVADGRSPLKLDVLDVGLRSS